MSNNDNQNPMDPQLFEQFLREVHSRLTDFEIDKEKTTEFFNEAVKQVNERYPGAYKVDYFETPEPDLDEE